MFDSIGTFAFYECLFSTTKTNKNHPQRHFSIPITTIALQNSHRLTTCASHRRQLAKQWFLSICHSKEAQKRGLLFITNPFPKHGVLALHASYLWHTLFVKSANKVRQPSVLSGAIYILSDTIVVTKR
ncbi:hypothetical protein ACTFQF_19625 [Aliivibrio fischeri]|uniref:hypothetical protein n=1 Tax=Aliivibrio fischeri TaxID=668 RepID=UPI0012907E51|nr:hypothetical protein [Aliivibrio fischeri]MBP3139597.1 hypothetical protein [Aliivibrio fischeri]MBP3153982.1 hypothetical protein [Aliivibrio fischeri]MCE7573360.1 hypothetical protein [Aliivibrio fischeri]